MEKLELTSEDLGSIIGDKVLAERILDGTYEINKPIAKVLGEHFGLKYIHFL